MSRKIMAKATVKGTLETLTPLSVGGTGVGEHVDIELATDGSGRCYIPGTSVAGAIRSWLERNSDIENFFGDTEASRIYIYDLPIANAKKERRHGISIHDNTGTVFGREGFFYTRAILPRGTSIPFQVELDITKESDGGLLALVIEALENGEIRFGGCRTRGMGKLYLKDTKINYYDFRNDKKALDLWLNDKPASINSLDTFIKPKLKTRNSFHVLIHWRPESNLMIKSGHEGIKTKIIPLVSGVRGNVAPVIPGSSLKGIFRYQARKIINTINGNTKIIDDMFGNEERTGRIFIDDIYCEPDNSPDLESWIDEENETLDRFTSGASHGALYNARSVKNSCRWEPIRITLSSFPEISETMLKQELALLKLLIRDFSEGYISIGFGSRRGLGKIADDCKVEYSPDFPTDAELQKNWNEFMEENK